MYLFILLTGLNPSFNAGLNQHMKMLDEVIVLYESISHHTSKSTYVLKNDNNIYSFIHKLLECVH